MSAAVETFNEQLVLYEWEHEFCERSLPFLYALGARRIGKSQLHREGREAELPHEWALGWKKGGSKRHRTRIKFRGVDYVDGDDEIGTPVIYDLPGQGRNWSQLYPTQAVGVRQVIEDSITLREEAWDEYNVNASFSVTNRQSISAGASVGPVEAKAEASSEQTASTSFGKTSGGRNVSERTQSIRTELDIPPGAKDILASSNIGKRKEVTPIVENGIIEADIEINLDDWSEERAKWLQDSKDEKRNVIRCATIQVSALVHRGPEARGIPRHAGVPRQDAPERWVGCTWNRRVLRMAQGLRNPPRESRQEQSARLRVGGHGRNSLRGLNA